MPINRIVSRTRSWSALNCGGLAILVTGACGSPEQGRPTGGDSSRAEVRVLPGTTRGEFLSSFCTEKGKRGSLLVARVNPKVEEGGVAFDLLGDGAGTGVLLCRDTLYADVTRLMKLMRDTASVSEQDGHALIDGTATTMAAFMLDGVLYVAAAPFARNRKAVLLPSPGQPTDATVWPRDALLHLKKSGLTQGRAFQAAEREGLVPE